MKFLRTITSKIKSIPTKVKAAAIVAAALATVSGAVFAGYTPGNRPTFDYNKGSDASNCAVTTDPGYDHGRCGSLNGPVFDSFVNTPYYGDERAFLDARMSDKTDTKDVLPYVTTGTKDVILRTYIHNNANQSTNSTGVGVAKDTKVRIALPTATDTSLRARSYITASNATPSEVTDTADLVDTTPFSVSYVPGSAKIYNGAHQGGFNLSDNIVTTGDLVGYDQMDGNFPGCFNYQAYVEIHVKINVPTVSITKQVKNATDGAWQKATVAKPGETVKWLVTIKNTGNTTLDDVDVSDALPPHFAVVPGSVKRTDGANNGVAQNDTSLFTDKGINFTSYGSGAALYVRFDTLVKDDLTTCEAVMQNQAFVTTKETPVEQKDTANVTIKKDNCTPPPTPVVTCDALTATTYSLKTGESTDFTAAATASHTTITGYIFKVNGQVVQDSASNKYTFTKGTEGTYAVDVTVKSPIGNVTSASCAKNITVTKIVTPIYTCDALTFSKATLLTGEKFTTTVRYTAAGGATFKQAVFNFGDSATYTTNSGTNGVVTAEHSFAAKGNYAITVKLDFLVNGQTKTVEGGNCANQVTVTTEKCLIPGKEQFDKNDSVHCNDVKGVTTLPNTGAGNMLGLFAGITVAGAVLHNVFTRRAFRR